MHKVYKYHMNCMVLYGGSLHFATFHTVTKDGVPILTNGSFWNYIVSNYPIDKYHETFANGSYVTIWISTMIPLPTDVQILTEPFTIPVDKFSIDKIEKYNPS